PPPKHLLQDHCPYGVRLRAGPSRCSGSVEVLMGGAWSSVCGRGFGLTEAAVVCAELDCGAVSELHQGALFTEGPAVGRSFHCDGAETSLKECESSETRCSAAANLTCSGNSLFDGFSCAGYMELRLSDEWRPVMTSEDLDLDFTSVLCRELGCGAPLLQGALSPLGQTFHCEGNESKLMDCNRTRTGPETCPTLNLTCKGKGAGPVRGEPLRLVGGASRCEGTVEAELRGEWRRVVTFDLLWDLEAAAAVCRGLDCGSPVSTEERDGSDSEVWFVLSSSHNLCSESVHNSTHKKLLQSFIFVSNMTFLWLKFMDYYLKHYLLFCLINMKQT
uniref:SRCR domain-containing protein n=1 Tax=Neogobius melanostomus TaxID=47308 RepID=A0A8C6WFZ8_9GOBI